MEISLRQAHALQIEIKNEIEKINLNPVISLSPLEGNHQEKISSHLEKTLLDYELKIELSKCYYLLRKLVAKANSMNGVDEILSDIENYSEIIKYSKTLENNSNIQSSEYIEKYFEHQLSSKDSYSRLSNLAVNALDLKTVESFKKYSKDTQKQIKSLKDKLLHLNVATKISLTEDVVTILTKVGLV